MQLIQSFKADDCGTTHRYTTGLSGQLRFVMSFPPSARFSVSASTPKTGSVHVPTAERTGCCSVQFLTHISNTKINLNPIHVPCWRSSRDARQRTVVLYVSSDRDPFLPWNIFADYLSSTFKCFSAPKPFWSLSVQHFQTCLCPEPIFKYWCFCNFCRF